MKKNASHVVVYRTGGYARFQWHNTIPYATYEEARQSAEEVQRMGHVTYVQPYDAFLSIGFPETHCTDDACKCEKILVAVSSQE